MKISSFDIFDTCILRKCGTPENFFDVFSLYAFNGDVEEWARQEFVAARRIAQFHAGEANPHYKLHELWSVFSWSHPLLKSTDELCQLEQDLERKMVVPVLSMREKVDTCRKQGHKILFISDMYLSTEFITEIMREHGFYHDGDSIYVSCDCNAAKWNGDLFRYVKAKEGLSSYRQWHHYGDNTHGDYAIPQNLGICCTLAKHLYTPYQQQWISNDNSLGYKCQSILAGIGRALRYSTEWTTHTDFVIDIVAPFYCSWIYQVMEDAQKKGIKRLYFCARDAYQIHKIALVMQPYFPEVGIEYVYMSRAALYKEDNADAKFAYYKRIGLATTKDKVAIVDTTTSGKTLIVLNEFLKTCGCKEVSSYYFLLWNKVEGVDRAKYNVQVYDAYDFYRNEYLKLYSIFENFFALNNELPTVDYVYENGKAGPLFMQKKMAEDIEIRDDVDWVSIHTRLLVDFARMYMQLQLGKDAKAIFENIGMRTLRQFYTKPVRTYLIALSNIHYRDKDTNKDYLYIQKIDNIRYLRTSARDFIWWEGSLYYSFSEKVINRIRTHFPQMYELWRDGRKK